ncbi:amidohydrolase family protein [Chloroflexota bacterium]
MNIFDAHVHVYYQMKLEAIIDPMDNLGITWSALLGVDHGLDGDERGTNVNHKFVADFVAQAPNRLVGFGSIHPDRKVESIPLLEDMILNLGLKGIKIYPHAGFYPDNPIMMEVYKRLEELKGVLLVHTGIKALPHQRIIFNRPLPVDEIAVACPNLQIIICHSGYPWVEEALWITRLNNNVWLDLTFLETLEIISGEPITWDILRKARYMIGCDRIIWGSEGKKLDLEMYPDAGLERMRSSIRRILDAPFLSEDEKENILGNNAAKLLEVEDEFFS